MDRRKCRVAIFWDIENFLGAVQRDKALAGYSIEDVLRAIAGQLDDIAGRYGIVVRKFGALSLPPPSSYQNSYRLRQWTIRTVEILQKVTAEWGCPVVFVPHGANAADNIIVETAISIAKRNKADVFLIATGDGKEPFPALFKHLMNSGKTVHVAAYNYVPACIKNWPGVKCSFVSGGVRREFASKEIKADPQRLLKANREGQPKSKIGENAPAYASGSTVTVETEIVPHRENGSGEENKLTETIAANIGESVLHFVKNRYEAVPPHHLYWIKEALNAFLVASSGAVWKAEFGRLLNLLRHHAAQWQNPVPTDEEITTLLQSLIRFGDIFEEKPLYVFNHLSELFKRDMTLST